jgi:putative pyruvate formate lyase activating enzyme
MTQYTPVGETAAAAGKASAMPDRYVSAEEYGIVLGWLEEFGIEDGYCQEPAQPVSEPVIPVTTGSEWLPDFSRTNPFSSELSQPVWHWREGFERSSGFVYPSMR